MTRTERSAFPRALMRDRSESKSGYDKSFRKSGGGKHNWGSIDDIEQAALSDEELAIAAEERESGRDSLDKPASERSFNSLSEEDKSFAKKFRKIAFKDPGAISLSDIARTSAAVSTSPDERFPIRMV